MCLAGLEFQMITESADKMSVLDPEQLTLRLSKKRRKAFVSNVEQSNFRNVDLLSIRDHFVPGQSATSDQSTTCTMSYAYRCSA